MSFKYFSASKNKVISTVLFCAVIWKKQTEKELGVLCERRSHGMT
jgi:hypothetical protein